jgi:hypothetical protein
MAPTAEMTAQRAAGETQDHHAGNIMPRRTSRLTKKKRAGFRRPSYAYAYATNVTVAYATRRKF